ncbi:hypothetical protein SLS61_008892 [Didymella pomorum]
MLVYDTQGQPIFHWANQPAANYTPTASSGTATTSEVQSIIERPGSMQAAAQLSTSPSFLPNFIAGTPETGYYDRLDPSYFMRTGSAAHAFWTVGRVFATLYTEAAGSTARLNGLDDAISVVRFGEAVYSQIRRFVVVRVRRQFVYALSIVTYRGQGGEYEMGMTKEPIEMTPSDKTIPLARESRIRFGKIYAIEWNVKVRDIGMVASKDTEKLLEYWRQEDNL